MNLSTILRSIRILDLRDRKKLIFVVFLQLFLGALDLAGVVLVGVIGALSVSGIKSGKPGTTVQDLLNLLQLNHLTFQTQVAVLGIAAALLLIFRTILSVIFTRKMIFFLSRRGTDISSALTSKFLGRYKTENEQKSIQETIFALTTGVQIITIGIIGSGLTFVSDGILLVVLFLGLVFVDPITALVTLLVFGFVSVVVFKTTSVRAVRFGTENSKLNIESNEKLFEVLSAFRESVVRNRRDYYAREIEKIREAIGITNAEIAFMPNISKYVTESTVILGAVLICGIQFILQDSVHAISTLAVFLAAGTRIAPAVMRMQQGIIVIKSNIGSSRPTLEILDALKDAALLKAVSDKLNIDHEGFNPRVSVSSLSWKYPESNQFALNRISIEIEPGEIVAIVGPSGAGKSSLADAILGVLPIENECVRISGISPEKAVAKWPGAIAYVPQDVSISNTTIRQNVGMGFPSSEIPDNLVWEALEIAQLGDFVKTLPKGIDAELGDRGMKMSGGQRQRLGIARAIFTKPKLLLLDEATSSLDGQTEADIASAIQKLRGTVTVIMIAHRLSTVREASRLVYMEKGQILHIGTFDELRTAVPDFDRQAKLMGL
jgi:ABC-type multidrug transport system fused ATPase/permease subunit